MTNREKSMFKIAKEISYLSDYKKQRVGAIVCERKNIISTGHNCQKTSPLQHKYNIYRNFEDYETSIAKQHAEINALARLIGKKVDWENTSIFIYRETKDKKPSCSRPCPACSKIIQDLGIKEIYYINENGRYVKEKVL